MSQRDHTDATAEAHPPMRVCILGCAGFIGSHLTARLLADDRHAITGVDRTRGKVAGLVGAERFTFVELDASRADGLRAIVESHDVVVHLAAICNPSLYNTRPSEVIASNFTHALPAIALCGELGKRLVYFSTCEVYGKTPAAVVRGGADDPAADEPYVLAEDSSHLILGSVQMQRWTYACAKQMTERVIYAEGCERGLSFTIVRPFNFIGTEMDYLPGIEAEGVPRVFPIFMRALLEGEPLPLVDGGRRLRTFVGIDEAVDACVRIVERPEACRGQIINIGNPANEISIAGLAELMIDLYAEKTGRRVSTTRDVPSSAFYGAGYDDCDRRVPDVRKARELLGWVPRVALREVFSGPMDYYIAKYGRGRHSAR